MAMTVEGSKVTTVETVDLTEELFGCSERGDEEGLVKLIRGGMNVNTKDNNQYGVLHVLAMKDNGRLIDLLVKEYNADVNIKTTYGNTPLHFACRDGMLASSKALIENKADVNATHHNGSTPLHSASIYGKVEIIRLLAQHGANISEPKADLYTPLHLAAQQGRVEAVQTLIDLKANIEAETATGCTPLQLALQQGQDSAADVLIKAGAQLPYSGG
eukprot:TRINITY_DN26079_c0_g1_i1.p1 TRINITY_DN26079_c0_g1~~TRINITY_DN26079_c0_g1_i1.p1  ORF type:complete len:216 (+),score=30.24 TRINITY_DN26079_c0_g1_i1:53-700(+)